MAGFIDDMIEGYEETKKSLKKDFKKGKGAAKEKKTAMVAKRDDHIHYGFSLIELKSPDGKTIGISREKEMFSSDPYFYAKEYDSALVREIKPFAFVGAVRSIPEESKMSFGETVLIWVDNGAGRFCRSSTMRKFLMFQDMRHEVDFGAQFDGISMFKLQSATGKHGFIKYGDEVIIKSCAYENMYVVMYDGYMKLETYSETSTRQKPSFTLNKSTKTCRNNPAVIPYEEAPPPGESLGDSMGEPAWVKDMKNAFSVGTMGM